MTVCGIIKGVSFRFFTVMRTRFALLILVLALVPVGAGAQYDVHFTHYWEVDNFFNPAAMNKNHQLNIVGSYSKQFAGYINSPGAMYVGANTVIPLGEEHHSIGFCLMNEGIGLFNHRRMVLNYAFKLKLKKGSLNIGAQLGLMNEKFRSSELDVIDPDDPAFPTGDESGSGFDLGAGLYYQHSIFYLGASAQHLNSPTVTYGKGNGKNAELVIKPSLYFQGGCNIRLRNPLLSVQPGVQVSSDLGTIRCDITLRGTYQYQENSFYGGFSYCPGTSVTFLVGGRVKKVLVGYAYEMFTNGIGAQNGSHDILLGYSMDVDFFKKGKNLHKSVRYL